MAILQEFYSRLYKEKPTDSHQILHFLDASPLKTLAEEHKLFLDKSITVQEVLDTIKRLKSNTAPGKDGYPPKFYKAFNYELAPHLANVGNTVLENYLLFYYYYFI